METWSWRNVIGRIVAIALLFFFLYALIDSLYLILDVLGADRRMPTPTTRAYRGLDRRYWLNALEEGTPPLTRTVTFSGTVTGVSVDLDLWIPRTHGLVTDIATGDAAENISSFTQAAFGLLHVEGRLLGEDDYSTLTWTLDPQTQLIHVHVRAFRETGGHIRGEISTPGLFVPGRDEVTLLMDGLRVHRLESAPAPQAVTLSRVDVRSDAPERIERIEFILEPVELVEAAEESAPPPAQPARESRQRFLQRLGDIIDIALVSRMLYSLVIALPLVIFWLWVPRCKEDRSSLAIGLVGAVGSLLLFHFALHFLIGSRQLAQHSSLFRFLPRRLTSGIGQLLGRDMRYIAYLEPYRLAPALFGVLLPGLLSRPCSVSPRAEGASTPRGERLPARLIRVAVVVLLVGGCVAPIACFWGLSLWEYGDPFAEAVPWWAAVPLAALLLTLGIWGAFYALYRCAVSRAPRPGLALLAALLTLAMAAVDGYAWGASRDPWLPFVWLVLAAALGTSLVLCVVGAVRAQMRQAGLNLTVPRWAGLLLILLIVVLTIPMDRLVSPTRERAYYYSVLFLTYRLDEWLIFIWLAGVLYFLYQEGRAGQRIGPLARMVGVLGVSSLLFNVSARWLYIPATFLIGWFMLGWWLVRPAEYWRAKLGPLFERVFEERFELLDQILDLNAAEGTYRQFRKKKGEQLAEGEIDLETYGMAVEKRRRRVSAVWKRSRIGAEKHPIREVALTFGPYESAWANGVHGARFALLFATPWIVLSLRDFFSGAMPSQTYPLWGFAAELLTVVARWGAYGFVLGSFYPYLRGKNGLQKGLGLFLCSVLASLPLMALFNTTAEAWQANLFWVLQVFIQCMLLGLVAFDYFIVRQGRYDWQMLFEVHGMTSVGVSVSSILVAVGAAVTTLVTSQATNLVTLALRFIIAPVSPDVPAP